MLFLDTDKAYICFSKHNNIFMFLNRNVHFVQNSEEFFGIFIEDSFDVLIFYLLYSKPIFLEKILMFNFILSFLT